MEPAPVSTDALVSPLHREASEHGGKWHPGRGTKTETLTGKEECWELTEGVASSIVEGGSGIGRVRTQQQVVLVDQMAERSVKSGHCFQIMV